MVRIWSIVLMSGDNPPWTHRIHSSIIWRQKHLLVMLMVTEQTATIANLDFTSRGKKVKKILDKKIKRNKTERSVNSSQVTHNNLITHISTMFSNPVRVHNYRSNGKKIKHSTAVSPCISIAILCLTFICKIFNKGYHMKWFKLSHQYIHLHKLILQVFLAQVPSFCFPQINPCFNINV